MNNEHPKAEFFDKFLKGKYAYWVQMRYIVPIGLHVYNDQLVGMKHEGYVACEEDITKLLQNSNGEWPKPYGSECFDSYDPQIIPYIDIVETDRVNNIMEFKLKNQYVTDETITLDEIKQFRTWLATELLLMDQTENGIQRKIGLTDTDIHVLEYYKNGMYDNTIKILSEFGSSNASFNQSTSMTSCGCSHSSDLSNLYNTSISVCDPISIYRKNIYEKMVVLFSNIEFWLQWSPEFIGVFKRYIDNIIKTNLPLKKTIIDKYFEDCGCNNSDIQNDLMSILKDLSISLEYIRTKNIVGHKNYINDSLRDWSTILYENMQW